MIVDNGSQDNSTRTGQTYAEGIQMTKSKATITLLGLALGALTARAQEAPMSGMKPQEAPMAGMKSDNAASHAASMTEMMGAPGLVPFEIMTGQAGRWMVGYQFMNEQLDGMLNGTHGVSKASVLNRFATTPADMTMHMHMAMVMYAPTDRLTLMTMAHPRRLAVGILT